MNAFLEWFICTRIVSLLTIFSERELVCPTQAVQIFGNISAALGTLAIR